IRPYCSGSRTTWAAAWHSSTHRRRWPPFQNRKARRSRSLVRVARLASTRPAPPRAVQTSAPGASPDCLHALPGGRAAVDERPLDPLRRRDAIEEALQVALHLPLVFGVQLARLDQCQHLGLVCAEGFGGRGELFERSAGTSIEPIGHLLEMQPVVRR